VTWVVAIGSWFVAVGAVLIGLAVLAITGAPVPENTFDMGPLGLLTFGVPAVAWATLGALLVARLPGSVIGRFAVVIGFGFAFSVLGTALLAVAVQRDGTAWRVLLDVAAWGTCLASLLTGLIFYVAAIFPTGHGHTRAWDVAVRALFVLNIVGALLVLTQPGPLHLLPWHPNPLPIGIDLRPVLGAPAGLILTEAGTALLAPIVVVSVVARYRAAGTIERLQLRWFISAVVLSLLGIVSIQIAATLRDVDLGDLSLAAFALCSATVPVAIGIAILRYRLYDIDRIVSRTVGYGLVTSALVVVFVGAVIGLQQVLDPLTGGNTIAVAASTLIVAALFQPLRRRVQRVVDRRFDRARYDGQQTTAAFAAQLRDEVDLGIVTEGLRRTVDRAVRPMAVSVWLVDRDPRP
jgi:hypothetical protein